MQPRSSHSICFLALVLCSLLLVAFSPITSFAGTPKPDFAGNSLFLGHGSSVTHLISPTYFQSDMKGSQYVYVNNGSSPNSVSGFKVTKSGLSPLSGSPYATGGTGGGSGYGGNQLAISPDHKCLFASDAGGGTFNSFSINANGSLTQVAHVSVEATYAQAIAVSPKGGVVFLGVFNYTASRVDFFTLSSGCSIIEEQSTNIGNYLGGLAISPDGSLLFVSSYVGQFINSYAINGASIRLLKTFTPKSPAPGGLIAVGSQLYSGNGATNAQTGAYSFSKDGTLTELPGSPATDSQGANSTQVWYDKVNKQLISSEQTSNSFGLYAVVKGNYTFLAHASGNGTAPTQMAQLSHLLFVTNDTSGGNVSVYTLARGKMTFKTLVSLPVSGNPNGIVAF